MRVRPLSSNVHLSVGRRGLMLMSSRIQRGSLLPSPLTGGGGYPLPVGRRFGRAVVRRNPRPLRGARDTPPLLGGGSLGRRTRCCSAPAVGSLRCAIDATTKGRGERECARLANFY